jgi:hypothetical protein
LDLRGLTHVDVATGDVRTLAQASPLKGVRRAFVVAQDVHYGLVRQFGVFREPSDEVRIFRDMDEARRWLELD